MFARAMQQKRSKPSDWKWSNVPSPLAPTPRFAHAFACLGTTEAVVAGGQTAQSADPNCQYLNDVYMLNITQDTWASMGPLPVAGRSHFTAVSLFDGELVAFFGGKTSTGVSNETFFMRRSVDNPIRWEPFASTGGVVPPPRRGHSATALLGSDTFLLFGGYDESVCLMDLYLFDAGSMQYIPFQGANVGTENWPCGRAFHCALSPDPNSLVIFGGRSQPESTLDVSTTMWHFDMRSGMWNRMKGDPRCVGRYGARAVWDPMTKMVITYGGRVIEDTTNNSSTVSGSSVASLLGYTDQVALFSLDSPMSSTVLPVEGKKPNAPSFYSMFIRGSEELLCFGGWQSIEGSATNTLWCLGKRQKVSISPGHVSAKMKHGGRAEMSSVLLSHQLVRGGSEFDPRRSLSPPPPHHPLAARCIDALLSEEYASSLHSANRSFPISFDELMALCKDVYQVFGNEPVCVSIRAPTKVFGDIHGQFGDLLNFFRTFGSPTSKGDINLVNYAFIGDFVDRGQHSLEVVLLLFSLKLLHPKRVFLIRGNHETSVINMVYGFAQECGSRFGPAQGETMWKAINSVFDMLPLAAVIEKRILCVHGGIGPSFTSIEQLFHLRKPIDLETLRSINEDHYWLVMHLLWADPADSDGVPDYEANPMRGDGIPKFPSMAVKTFCDQNNIDCIIRAHQPVMGGFELFADGQLITVFSATNYCGREKNSGGMLEVNTDLEITAKTIAPRDENEWNATQYRPPSPPRGRI